MNSTSLDDLILRFEPTLPDQSFTELVVCLGEEARRRASSPLTADSSACYSYLLARVYELLGYYARHTPWLSNSEKFYWQKAIGFFEQARECTPAGTPQHYFLDGKALTRKAINHIPDKKRGPQQDWLKEAEQAFMRAAKQETSRSLAFIFEDDAEIVRSEAQQRMLHEQLLKMMAQATPVAWLQTFEEVWEKTRSFTVDVFRDLPSNEIMDWPAQHALAEARVLFAEARMLESLVPEFAKAPQEHKETVRERLEESERRILQCFEKSAAICRDAGLTVRGAHTRVTKLRRSAERALRDCVYQFKLARETDSVGRNALLAKAERFSYELPPSILPILAGVPGNGEAVGITTELLEALVQAGVGVSTDFSVLNDFGRHWLITDGFDRYVLHEDGGKLLAVDLAKQPIPFDHIEAKRFNDFGDKIAGTCQLLAEATREIDQALREAAELYERLVSQLRVDMDAVRDPDLRSLFVTASRILGEFKSKHYPLLSTLRDRTVYAWSLLEMFQMRNGSVRLGTLFSGQCHLIMRNPFYHPGKSDAAEDSSDEFLHVGADPIFRTTIDFLFRGAKGEENRHDFQRRALTATLATIEQQEKSLLSETRYVEIGPETRRALIARLKCHRNLALALKEFTPVFIVQKPLEMPTEEIEKSLDGITKYMGDARTALAQAAQHGSKLIDDNGLEAIRSYMSAIGRVLVGMNQRTKKNPAWSRTYATALQQLNETKRKLEAAGDVYLIPAGSKRKEYLDYVEARLMTVSGWQAWYRAEDSKNPKDFEKAADLFDRATALYRDTLFDYRVATKAEGRAMEARTDSVKEIDSDSRAIRYSYLREANAIYAACDDAGGFERTWKHLQQEFAYEESRVPRRPRSAAGMAAPNPVPSPIPRAREVFGAYVIEPLDDIGGMGMVFKAWKDGEGPVALKRILERYATKPEFLQRFHKEIDIIKGLVHPHIISIFDSGEADGVPYFTMEFLDGQTLDKVLTKGGRLESKRAAKIVWQMVAALDYAHSKGITHRDLKPSNVMLLARDRVKVLDFGVASSKQFGTITPEGMFVGTYEYAAPEHIRTGLADDKSDLYALGLIFYELLTGHGALPWRKRLEIDHPSPAEVIADLPPALVELVVGVLKLKPDARLPRTDIIARLRVFLGAEAVG